jgi:ketosteroid isomerase-like protein
MTRAEEIASALHAALETGDVDAFATCMADDALVWHNSDRVELPKGEALARIAAAARVVDGIRVEVVRFVETTFGFVEQIVLRGAVTETRAALELHNCVVVSAPDGVVVRIDEYVDPNVSVRSPREPARSDSRPAL